MKFAGELNCLEGRSGVVLETQKKGQPQNGQPLEILVGARGFEPPTSWSQTKRATRLRYAPTDGIGNMVKVKIQSFFQIMGFLFYG